MSKEMMQSITDAAMKLRPLMASLFTRPMREMEKGLFPHGYVHLLLMIGRMGGPVSMTDLATMTCISRPNLTTMVDRLCAEGLVERGSDEKDRRVVKIAITNPGLEFLQRRRGLTQELIEEQLSVLEEKEIARLKFALEEMMDVLTIIEGKSN